MTKKNEKGGRPSKLTERVVRKLDEAFRQGYTVTEACEEAEISRETYYHHLNTDRKFSDKMGRAQRYLIGIAKRNWVKAIEDGDWHASMKFLERREPERYSLRWARFKEEYERKMRTHHPVWTA